MQKIFAAVRNMGFKAMAIKSAVFSVLFVLSFIYDPLIFVAGGLLAILIIIEFDYKSITHLFFFSAWLYNYMIAMFFVLALTYAIVATIKCCVVEPRHEKRQINIFPLIVAPLCLMIILSYPGQRVSWLLLSAYTTFLVLARGREIGFKTLINFFVVGVLVSGLVGLLRYANWPSTFLFVSGDLRRFSGLCRNPNVFYLFVICALCAMFYANLKTKKIIWWHVPIIAVLIAFGFMTISRGFYIAFIAVLLVYSLMLLATFKRKSAIIAGVVCFAVVLGALLSFPFAREGFKRLTIITEQEHEYSQNADLSIDNSKYYDPGRIGIWKKNLKEWVSSPKTFFIGHGITSQDIWGIGEHNTVIHILSKTGLVGLLLVILFFVVMFLILYRVLRCKFSALPFLFLIACLACGLTEEMFPKFHFFMFVYLFILSTMNGYQDFT